jgi:hypothetical protein
MASQIGRLWPPRRTFVATEVDEGSRRKEVERSSVDEVHQLVSTEVLTALSRRYCVPETPGDGDLANRFWPLHLLPSPEDTGRIADKSRKSVGAMSGTGRSTYWRKKRASRAWPSLPNRASLFG